VNRQLLELGNGGVAEEDEDPALWQIFFVPTKAKNADLDPHF